MCADSPHGPYVLGHSTRELERLRAQAQLIDPFTRECLIEAGVRTGMRVLDVGCGVGDVSLIVADLVGGAGEVVGVDRAPSALAVARSRASVAGRSQLSFIEGDPATMTFAERFDAVVGRYVLQFQPDPAAMLRVLSQRVRAGGIVAFHEIDWGGARSFPPAPTYDRCCGWIVDTLQQLGAQPHMGIRLHATFTAAGLAAPSMRLGAVLGAGTHAANQVGLLTDLMHTLLPEMERLGVISSGDVDVAALSDRIYREVCLQDSVIIPRTEIAAWARVT